MKKQKFDAQTIGRQNEIIYLGSQANCVNIAISKFDFQ